MCHCLSSVRPSVRPSVHLSLCAKEPSRDHISGMLQMPQTHTNQSPLTTMAHNFGDFFHELKIVYLKSLP